MKSASISKSRWILLLMVLAATGNAWGACTGEACDDVDFSFQDGCYVTRNVGNRKVRVELGPYGFQLKAGQAYTLRINGNCPQNYMGGERANYLDPPKTSRAGSDNFTPKSPQSELMNIPPPPPPPPLRVTPLPRCEGRGCSETRRIDTTKLKQQAARQCRPNGGLPSGSYRNSCTNCRIEQCQQLVCQCDGNVTSADMTKCSQGNYCNNKGNLQCGEC